MTCIYIKGNTEQKWMASNTNKFKYSFYNDIFVILTDFSFAVTLQHSVVIVTFISKD